MGAANSPSKPYKGLEFEFIFPIFDTNGALVTGAASFVEEVSIDGAAFAACSNAASEISGAEGMYKLTLTAAEMNGAVIAVVVKSDQATTPIVFYTSTDVLERGTAQAGGGNNEIILRSGPRLITGDGFFDNMWVAIIDGTGEGQKRLITSTAYNSGTTTTCTLERDWGTNPDATSVYEIYMDDIDTISADGSGFTALGGMGTAMKAEVEAEANDALVALKLDHLVAVADSDDVVNNSIIAKMVSKAATADWSDFLNTTDSLEAIRDVLTTVNSETTAIKAKTDSLVFTVANKLDVNIHYINDTEVAGTGVEGDRWRAA